MFTTADGADILISIQNDREWVVLARDVMGDAALAEDPAFATNVARIKRRADTDARVAAAFAAMDLAVLSARLVAHDIAFARVNDPELVRHHPHLRRVTIETPSGPVSYPAPAVQWRANERRYGPVPALAQPLGDRAGQGSSESRFRSITACSRVCTQ